ncbi:hypothetical protein V063_02704 [Staphylococcus aureus R0487]|nr:hypothetical protein V063_02704 [Staphylococcus aureus R0487]
MLYLQYWRNIFNYNGTSKLRHLGFNIFINIIMLILIMASGIFVPISLENIVVDIYYSVLFIMILPTLSMIVRVVNNYRSKFKK